MKCDYLVYIQAAAPTKGWDPDQASAVYEYYQPGTSASVPGTWQTGPPATPGCNGATPIDPTLKNKNGQRIVVTINGGGDAIGAGESGLYIG
ncbi:MAG: hypothetical protein ABI862_04135 [Ilumatobacteraceae bacterium]